MRCSSTRPRHDLHQIDRDIAITIDDACDVNVVVLAYHKQAPPTMALEAPSTLPYLGGLVVLAIGVIGPIIYMVAKNLSAFKSSKLTTNTRRS